MIDRAAAASRPLRVLPEFFTGAWMLLRGFGVWRRRPGLMALGLLPAFLVAAVIVAVLVLVAFNVPAIGAVLTPFASEWDGFWRESLRLVVGLAALLGLLVLLLVTFTAVVLAIGDPFYERIWREVENETGMLRQRYEPGFWRAAGDALLLVVRAAVTGALLALLSLIPVVGTVLAFVLAVFLSGRLLAHELTTRPLEARGLRRVERRRLLRTRNPLVYGFGAAVHLSFLVPLGAVLVMPAAVAGATYLAHEVLGAGDGSVGAGAGGPLEHEVRDGDERRDGGDRDRGDRHS